MTEPTAVPADSPQVVLRADRGGASARFEHTYAAPIDDVWSAVTEPERIGRWLAPTTIHGEAAEGVAYTIAFDDGGEVTGTVTACHAPEHLAVSWVIAGEAPSTVTIDLRADGDGTRMVLDHRRLPSTMVRGYAAGWGAYAERLGAELADDTPPDWDERFDARLAATAVDTAVLDAEPSGFVLGRADRPVVVLERILDAAPADVWSAWTDPDRLRRWLGAVDRPLTGAGTVVRVAMAADELPPDPAAAENPATFTVHESTPPTADTAGRLVFTFDDRADPGGVVTITMAPEGDDRCRLVLQHALIAGPTTEHAGGFGAGWDGFLDWLETVVAGGEVVRGDEVRYDALQPYYAHQHDRVLRSGGSTSDADGTVRHVRTIAASPWAVWDLLTTADGVGSWLGEVVDGGFGPDGDVVVDHDPRCPASARPATSRPGTRPDGWR